MSAGFGSHDESDKKFNQTESDQKTFDVPTHYNSKGDSILKKSNFLTGSEVARSTLYSH